MEIHQLRYFIAVAQEGGFTRAAELVHVAQPSLSQQILKLEAEVGQPLFERMARGVSLTEAGLKLLPYARRILKDVGDALRCVEERQETATGTVTLGIIPTIAPYIVGPLLREFTTNNPGATLHVLEDVTERLVRALEHGELDLAIVSRCRNGASTPREFWQREPLLLVVPQAHPAAAGGRACLDVLREEPFLALEESHCLTQEIGQWCDRHQVRRRTTLPALQLSTIVAMVAAGRGVSILPAMAVNHEQGRGCAFLSLQGPAPEREINLLRNPARMPGKTVETVASLARQTVANAVGLNPRGA